MSVDKFPNLRFIATLQWMLQGSLYIGHVKDLELTFYVIQKQV